MPNTIRYQPKALKLFFLIYPIKNLMERIETTKATTIPTKRTAISSLSKAMPNFINFKKLAPNITGTAKKR